MNTISISELKINPSIAIKKATDFPMVIKNRNKSKAYLVGINLYEKIISFIEDYIDKQTVEKTDFSKGKDFEKVAKSLGI
ncbi:MAG: type II toxin-antitoxin system Phd/YefM family antitoxin [Patescibacteria group bacterium]|nr:type II toxin-antitoxin system Phd/YefM family antitoxin [Patescibacteria group bacterium]